MNPCGKSGLRGKIIAFALTPCRLCRKNVNQSKIVFALTTTQFRLRRSSVVDKLVLGKVPATVVVRDLSNASCRHLTPAIRLWRRWLHQSYLDRSMGTAAMTAVDIFFRHYRGFWKGNRFRGEMEGFVLFWGLLGGRDET
jgi:hypothetical protein